MLPLIIANSHDSSSFWSKRKFPLHSWMLLLWCRYNSSFFVKITLKQTKYTYNCNLVCHVFFSLFFSLLSLVHFSVIFLTFVYRICTCYKLLLFCKSRVVSSLLRCQSWLQRMFAYGTIFIFWHNGRILNTISLLNKHLNQCKP